MSEAAGAEVELVAPAAHAEFQYSGPEHEAETAQAGMWLFLATELLFFGGLFFLYLWLGRWHPQGFARAARETDLLIGTANTVVLLTASALYAVALHGAKRGRSRGAALACIGACLLGVAFAVLKGLEWMEDAHKDLLPGIRFGLHGTDEGGAQLFYILYYAGTGLHAVHLLIGVGLVGWIAWRAWRGEFRPGRTTAVEAVGLYWGFVDMMWLVLYPLIYLNWRT